MAKRSIKIPLNAGKLVAEGAKRCVETETQKVATGKKSEALSSKQCVFYHDVPPELYRRIALRYTNGHKKYSPDITMNLNWRLGLSDAAYVMDRLNHLFDHAFAFLEDGNALDDNLAAIAWCCGFLMEVERLYPDLIDQVIGQSKLHGETARNFKQLLQEKQK
jgi:dATP/dGTP diphosphohydrolase